MNNRYFTLSASSDLFNIKQHSNKPLKLLCSTIAYKKPRPLTIYHSITHCNVIGARRRPNLSNYLELKYSNYSLLVYRLVMSTK